MTRIDVDRVFDYECSLIHHTKEEDYLFETHMKLLEFLNRVLFVWNDETNPLDGNVADYAAMQRGYKLGIYDKSEVSLFETMACLAYKLESTIMASYEKGDRTGYWFWGMISSMGLIPFDDFAFDEEEVSKIVLRFMNREYEPNGEGGLFFMPNCTDDLTKEDIWTQAMWYLSDYEYEF